MSIIRCSRVCGVSLCWWGVFILHKTSTMYWLLSIIQSYLRSVLPGWTQNHHILHSFQVQFFPLRQQGVHFSLLPIPCLLLLSLVYIPVHIFTCLNSCNALSYLCQLHPLHNQKRLPCCHTIGPPYWSIGSSVGELMHPWWCSGSCMYSLYDFLLGPHWPFCSAACQRYSGTW